MNPFVAISCHLISYAASRDEAAAKMRRRRLRRTIHSLEAEIRTLSDNALYKLINFRQPLRYQGKVVLHGRVGRSQPGPAAQARGRRMAATIAEGIAAIEAEISFIERSEGYAIAALETKAHKARLLVAIAKARRLRLVRGQKQPDAAVPADGQLQFSFY